MKIYTETVLHGAEPFQLAIATRDDGTRVTGRVLGERVAIDDEVEETAPESDALPGVVYFRKR